MRSLINLITGLWSFVVGLWVTLVNTIRSPVTFQYPEKYYVPLERFRGHPALLVDPETGKVKCTGCQSCARACPNGLIEMEVVKGEDGKRHPVEFRLNFARCMVCGLCVEACPFDALVMSPDYELSEYEFDDLLYDLEHMKFPAEGMDVRTLDGREIKAFSPGGEAK